MRSALLALSTLFASVPATGQMVPARPCAQAQPQRADQRQPARIRKLVEMPPGTQMLAVLRSVDGCYRPAVVRENVGLPPRR